MPHAADNRAWPIAGVSPCRVLVVDDSAVARFVVQRIVNQSSHFVVAGQAADAQSALAKLDSIDVDLIILDIEMPRMSGIDAIPHLLSKSGRAPILIVSAFCNDNARATLRAMALGAGDTVLKPSGAISTSDFAGELESAMLRLWQHERRSFRDVTPLAAAQPRRMGVTFTPKCLAIGSSTGGVHALSEFFAALPRDIEIPMMIAQHLPAEFTSHFAAHLAKATGRDVSIADDGKAVAPGAVMIVPGGRQMTIESKDDGRVVRLGSISPNAASGVSVDALFEAVGDAYGGESIGIVLSGMGRDGARGAGAISARGGEILAQDAQSAAIWGMPGAVVENGTASRTGTPAELAAYVEVRAHSFSRG